MFGLASLGMGERDAARSAFQAAISLFADARDISGVVLSLDDFAQLEADAGDITRAIRLSAAAAALEQTSGTKLASVSGRLGGQGRPSDRIDNEEQARAFADGQRMSLEDAVAYALGTGPQP